MDVPENLTLPFLMKRVAIKKEIVAALTKMNGFVCTYCDFDLNYCGHHVDHIIPITKGGDDSLSNLCLSCPQCNIRAGNKVFNSLDDKKKYLLALPPLPKTPKKTVTRLNPPRKSRTIMIRMPVDFYTELLEKATDDKYKTFTEFVLTSLKYFSTKPIGVKIDTLRKEIRHGKI